MTRRELDAAGITGAGLRLAYQRCRELNARHGRTYFLATRMLAPAQRPAVHALYGFARWVDDVVDEPEPGATPESIAAALHAVEDRFFAELSTGHSEDPVRAAVLDTVSRYAIDEEHFRAFFASMRMDLTVTGYPTRAALDEYVHGSAEVIGLQVLPVLGTVVPRAEAAPRAAALGKAFQLTNFLRDVAEDLERGRVYLPADELAADGVDRDRLGWCARTRRIDPAVRRALAAQIASTRRTYAEARPGIAMLHPASRPCVETAFVLYGGILDRIEAAGYNVFAGRARVPKHRRLLAACDALVRAQWARRRQAVA
ncbi:MULTISPECIES: phytoene/squalene synthase family protein [unclassified Amycolatopsis]|uniref:phytoene/squalene synthase family protein n=1 Tax=unclassified Amycolatopsis TaxID=2618356 RepID=UPI001FF4B749|nr:phytoene/squalene synthase family protein [Amycolatopsis sp. FBCC-B4732]UOX92672.1 phytoene/squalene synthase family protein [Amycolatopsis sp. FBCC-B4732]